MILWMMMRIYPLQELYGGLDRLSKLMSICSIQQRCNSEPLTYGGDQDFEEISAVHYRRTQQQGFSTLLAAFRSSFYIINTHNRYS